MNFLILILILLLPLKLAAAEKIVIASLEIPPYVIAESPASPQGILVELIKYVARDANVEVDFVVLPWARALADTKMGAYDAIIPTMRNNERDAFLNFYQPIITFEISLFSLKGQPKYGGHLVELKNKFVARILGQSGGENFDKYIKDNNIDLFETHSFKQSLETLIARRSDFALLPKLVGQYIKKSLKPSLPIEASLDPVGLIDIHVAFTKKRTSKHDTYQKFNLALKKLKANGKMAKKTTSLVRLYGLSF